MKILKQAVKYAKLIKKLSKEIYITLFFIVKTLFTIRLVILIFFS